ncbi:MAG: hypothetical protein ACE5OZ_22670 [Candidatus Heimdallarchaeota archaeon]
MYLRKTNVTALTISIILLLAGGIFAHSASAQQAEMEWGIEDTTLVYETTHLLWNGTDTEFPMYSWNGTHDEEAGSWAEGDLSMFEVRDLPDPNQESSNVVLDWRGSGFEDDREFNYTIEFGWPNASLDGPAFLWPLSSVPVDPANWTDFEGQWTGVTNITATYASAAKTFTLVGQENATLNITGFQVVWDTTTGIMQYYWLNSTWGPESEGTKAIPIEIELNFLYYEDPGQWDMGFGLNPGDMAAWRIDTLDFNNTEHEVDQVPWKTDSTVGGSLEEGDVIFINFMELWDPAMGGGEGDMGPHWNGSIMTPEEHYNVMMPIFGGGDDDGGDGGGQAGASLLQQDNGDDGGGPGFMMFWIPLWPTGNDLFYGNMTNMLNMMFGDWGGLDFNSTHLWVDIYFNDPFGGHLNLTAEWDRDTGLLLHYFFDGFLDDPVNHDVHTPFTIETNFLYYLNNTAVDASWDVSEGHYQRFVLTNLVVNGSLDYLEMSEDFILYQGDIIGVHFEDYIPETDSIGTSILEIDTLGYWNLYMRTSSGEETEEPEWRMQPPGMETTGGPPLLYWAVPTGNDAWWNALEDAYSAVGYTVTNGADTFSMSGEINDDEFSATFDNEWDKASGSMITHNINASFDDGSTVDWRIEGGVTFDPNDISWDWGVATGDHIVFDVAAFDRNGDPYRMPIGPNDETTIGAGDQMTLTVNALGGLGTEEDGMAIDFTMTIHDYTESWTIHFPEPGFEFIRFYDDGPDNGNGDDDGGGGPPLFYPVIPVGDAAYWDLLEDMYGEAGYTVSNDASSFTVEFPSERGLAANVTWDKATGIIQYYDGEWTEGEEGGSGDEFHLGLTYAGDTPPTYTGPAGSESSAPATVPGFEGYLVLLVFSGIAVVLRRRFR